MQNRAASILISGTELYSDKTDRQKVVSWNGRTINNIKRLVDMKLYPQNITLFPPKFSDSWVDEKHLHSSVLLSSAVISS